MDLTVQILSRCRQRAPELGERRHGDGTSGAKSKGGWSANGTEHRLVVRIRRSVSDNGAMWLERRHDLAAERRVISVRRHLAKLRTFILIADESGLAGREVSEASRL